MFKTVLNLIYWEFLPEYITWDLTLYKPVEVVHWLLNSWNIWKQNWRRSIELALPVKINLILFKGNHGYPLQNLHRHPETLLLKGEHVLPPTVLPQWSSVMLPVSPANITLPSSALLTTTKYLQLPLPWLHIQNLRALYFESQHNYGHLCVTLSAKICS